MSDIIIPKIIHYCWFGGNPLPDLAKKCIESWKKFLPDYEIKEWNENNYDVRKIPYIAQAYDSKKYAFVSDYARFDILYEYGGIYFDTDVEVIKPLDEILCKGAFAGLESAGSLAAGLGIAAPPQMNIYKEILESYNSSEFINPKGFMDLTTVVERVSNIFSKYGFSERDEIQKIADVNIYPTEFFCPIDPKTGILNITDKTLTIHHYAATWTIPLRKKYMKIRNNLSMKIGIKMSRIILFPMQIICIIKEVGIKSLFEKIKK